MSTITIYNTTTGEIAKVLSCDESQIGINVEPGQSYLDGSFDRSNYIADGQPVIFPSQPNASDVWNWTTKAWVDLRTLGDMKALKWADIKTSREGRISAPLQTPYGTFDSDSAGRTNITDAVLMLQTLASMGNPQSIDFTLANNTFVTLSTTEMVNVALMLGQKVQTAHAISRDLREQIEAALTITDVEAIVWPVT